MNDVVSQNLLIRFCRDIENAIRTNGKNAPWFDSHYGLCYNLEYWGLHNNLTDSVVESIDSYMHSIFVEMCDNSDETRSTACPFTTDIHQYWSERRRNTVYDNIYRLAFITEWATKTPEEEMPHG